MKLDTRQVALAGWLALVASILLLSAGQVDSLSSSASSPKSSSSSSSSSSSTATQTRQSPMSLMGAVGSLLPNLISNVAPLVVLFGLGALMMPALGLNAMGLLREGRRSSAEQNQLAGLANMQLPGAFNQYARPLQTSPQDVYYFTRRSLPGFMSQLNTGAIGSTLQELFERVGRAIDNADKTYNNNN